MTLTIYVIGTYFGTQEEYDALNFEARLAQNAAISIHTLDHWLGAVGNWAETEALKLIGGIVSEFMLRWGNSHSFYSPVPFTRRVSPSSLRI